MVTVARRMGVRRYFIGMSCSPGQLSEACFSAQLYKWYCRVPSEVVDGT